MDCSPDPPRCLTPGSPTERPGGGQPRPCREPRVHTQRLPPPLCLSAGSHHVQLRNVEQLSKQTEAGPYPRCEGHRGRSREAADTRGEVPTFTPLSFRRGVLEGGMGVRFPAGLKTLGVVGLLKGACFGMPLSGAAKRWGPQGLARLPPLSWFPLRSEATLPAHRPLHRPRDTMREPSGCNPNSHGPPCLCEGGWRRHHQHTCDPGRPSPGGQELRCRV